MAENCDVVIVGGGPAGLSAAASAASKGARTILLERQNEIGEPIHTSGGSWIKHLRDFSIPERFYHPVSRVIFVSPGREVNIETPEPRICILDVRAFYQFLAERAAESGADIRMHHKVDRLIKSEDNKAIVGVHLENETGARHEIRAGVTIDASGFSRHLTVRAGLRPAFHRYGFGAEYDFYAPSFPEDSLYLIMGNEVAPSGYAWAGACGEHRARVGVGIIHQGNHLDARVFLKSLLNIPVLEKALKGSKPIEYHTGLFPAENPERSFCEDGLLVIGDAAGQGSTLLGEGIRFVMHSGKLAGVVAADAIHAGDVSVDRLKIFDRLWNKKFGRDMRISFLINRRIARYSDEQWDNALAGLGTLTLDNMARFLSSDFRTGSLLKAAVDNPRLLSYGFGQFFRDIQGRLGATFRGESENS